MDAAKHILAIDTCGPTGSVALARLADGALEILGQRELEGRSYSATLIGAVGELLAQAGSRTSLLHAMVAVNGPGSFTGVRVGLAAVKGLAEAAQIPVVAVSRLGVLATKAGVASAALDAHRNEIFLRVGSRGPHELLAGSGELAAIDSVPGQIAVCDEAAAALLRTVWPQAELVQSGAPNAVDALHLCASRVANGEFTDLILLDGHYLRRSDAEIFGNKETAGTKTA
jgi:tRNA threonylcarbamoyladenosine biosynthesis protein TsaB